MGETVGLCSQWRCLFLVISGAKTIILPVAQESHWFVGCMIQPWKEKTLSSAIAISTNVLQTLISCDVMLAFRKKTCFCLRCTPNLRRTRLLWDNPHFRTHFYHQLNPNFCRNHGFFNLNQLWSNAGSVAESHSHLPFCGRGVVIERCAKKWRALKDEALRNTPLSSDSVDRNGWGNHGKPSGALPVGHDHEWPIEIHALWYSMMRKCHVWWLSITRVELTGG